MRMWGVEPSLLCQQHLLGEHVEMHMFVGTIRKGISIQGYIDKGLVDPAKIKQRHEELSAEMVFRGMNHNSPLLSFRKKPACEIDALGNKKELHRRCPACRERIEGIE